jgi:hypothetical protein
MRPVGTLIWRLICFAWEETPGAFVKTYPGAQDLRQP